jgi:hypothetical protein
MTELLTQPELQQFFEWALKNREAILALAGGCLAVGLAIRHKHKKREGKRKDKDSRPKLRGSRYKGSRPPQQKR